MFASGILPKHRKFPFSSISLVNDIENGTMTFSVVFAPSERRMPAAKPETDADRILNSAERHSHILFPAYRKSRTYCLFFHIPHHTYPSDCLCQCDAQSMIACSSACRNISLYLYRHHNFSSSCVSDCCQTRYTSNPVLWTYSFLAPTLLKG